MRLLASLFCLALCFAPVHASAQADGSETEERTAIALINILKEQRVPPRNVQLCEHIARLAMKEIFNASFSEKVVEYYDAVLKASFCIDRYSQLRLAASHAPMLPMYSPTDTPASGSAPPFVPSVHPEEFLNSRVPYVHLGKIEIYEPKKEVADTVEAYRRRSGTLPSYMILDLRDSPGGYLAGAFGLLELFSPKPKMLAFTLRPRAGEPEPYQTKRRGPYAGIPLAVLVNAYTASAAETIAGVLQRWGGVIIGSRTYTKGVYTRDHSLGLLTLKITTGDVLLGEEGTPYHGVGIFPDQGMTVRDASVKPILSQDEAICKALEGLRLP